MTRKSSLYDGDLPQEFHPRLTMTAPDQEQVGVRKWNRLGGGVWVYWSA